MTIRVIVVISADYVQAKVSTLTRKLSLRLANVMLVKILPARWGSIMGSEWDFSIASRQGGTS